MAPYVPEREYIVASYLYRTHSPVFLDHNGTPDIEVNNHMDISIQNGRFINHVVSQNYRLNCTRESVDL